MNEKSVTIISVNYNGVEHTSEMIESLQKHETYPFELVIVDNGSTKDESIAIKETYPWVNVIRSEKNLGFAGGNNLGMNIASGEYIFLLNNDTLIREPLLEKLVNTFSQYPNTGAVSPKILFEYSDRVLQYAGFTRMSGITLRNNAIGYSLHDNGDFNQPSQTFFAHGAAMMLSREVIDRVGMMPECYFLYYEEMDWCEKIRNAGYNIIYQPNAELFHKESMATGNISGLKIYYQVRNRLLFARRNRKTPQKQLSIAYQLSVAIPKLLLTTLSKGDLGLLWNIKKGAIAGLLCKCMALLIGIMSFVGCGPNDHKKMADRIYAYAKDSIGIDSIPNNTTGGFEIEITAPIGAIPSDSVYIPKLKYDKAFAYTFTGDDTYASIYRKAMMICLGRNTLRLDKNRYEGVDADADQTMAYSDPFGRTHLFKFGISAQIFHKYGIVTPYFSRYKAFTREYMTWDELDAFEDFGCGIYNHGGGLIIKLLGLNEFSFGVSQGIFESHLGSRPKIMIRPDGDDNYIDLAQKMPEFAMCTTEGTYNNFFPKLIDLKDSTTNLRSSVQMRTCLDGVAIEEMIMRIDSLASLSNGEHGYWIHDFVHSISDDELQSVSTSLMIAYLSYINNRYGIKGSDKIWFASMDEVYEYWFMRRNVRIETSNNNGVSTIKIVGIMPNDFKWKEFSFKVLSPKFKDIPIDQIKVKGGLFDIYNTDQSGLNVFVSMSNISLLRAIKYLMFLDDDYTNYNLQNARFFVDRAPQQWKDKLEKRLNHIVESNKSVAL